ncbi:MAG: Na(+)/H(+) antiporter subunit C [Firmicutes bacterium]|nr:Na(+)/H(+) antiporter subunit C [Bacillota bacterium]
MELLIAIVIGALFSAGIYLLLSRTLLRILLGVSLTTHGVLLLLLAMGKLNAGAAPLLHARAAAAYADPLPQALILTAIVIGFGITAFLIVLCYRAYQVLGSDDTELCRGAENE